MNKIFYVLLALIVLMPLYSALSQAETKTVTFTVKSSITRTVSGATINFAGYTKTTGIGGHTEFTSISTTEAQDYTCSCPGYSTTTGQVSADARTAEVGLSKTSSSPIFSGFLGLVCLAFLTIVAIAISRNRRI